MAIFGSSCDTASSFLPQVPGDSASAGRDSHQEYLKRPSFRLALISSLLVLALANPIVKKGRVAVDPNYELTWVLEPDTEGIIFTVVAQTTGWVGLGISGRGGMSDADIAIGGVTEAGDWYFGDYYSSRAGRPSLDAEQNWHLVSASQNATSTILVIHRNYISPDTAEDNDITADGNDVIFAWGETDDIAYHGSGSRGEVFLNFLG